MIAGAITPIQIMMPSTWSTNTPKSIVKLKNNKSYRLKKEPVSLKIRLDLPHETAKRIARLVKMNSKAPRNYERKPCRLGTD